MEDPTGIELENLASELELETLTLPISWLADEAGKEVLVTGVALTEGVWKNVIYSASELEKYAPTLKGKPVLIEHGNTKEFGSRPVGRVIDSYFEKNLKGIIFKAKITDPLAKKLVKREILPAVSCSTWMDKKPINERIRLGRKYQFAEMSLVRTPACDRCFIFHQEQLSALKEGKSFNIIKETEIDKGENLMETFEEEELETLSEVEEEEEELMGIEELEAPKLYAILELPDEESLESLRRSKRVVSYYYGYPYYAPYYKKYPYRYPYKYPYRGSKQLSEEPALIAVVELEGKEDLVELRQTYRVKNCFYSQNGYPTLGYPYRYKYKYLYPKKLGAEELSLLQKSIVGTSLPEETPKPVVPEAPIAETPNPDSCAKMTCPVCDKEFEDEKEFQAHWAEEHKEKYGDFKETMTILTALTSFVDLAKGDTKITKMKNGRFVVFVDTGKTGFGQWKIVGNFATEKEAKDAAAKAGGKEEKQAEEEKDEHGCIVGKEEWCEDEKKCKPVSKEEQSAYTDFVKKCMQEEGMTIPKCAARWKKEEKSAYTDHMKKCMTAKAKEIPDVTKRMKACAAEWKAPEKKQKDEEPGFVCPACKKKFESEKDLATHWKDEHKEKYGPLKKGYKYPEKEGLAKKPYYYYKHKGKYYPYYYRKGKIYRKEKKPKKK